MENTFADRYCARHRIARTDLLDSLLWRGFYLHATPLLPLIPFLSRDFLASDRELLRALSVCRSFREIQQTLRSIPSYYSAQWGFRQRFRIRISARRLLRIAQPLFADSRS